MIYEVRSYDMKPHSMGEVLKRFGDAYPTRAKYSELVACWTTDIGPLNRLIHVWGYESAAERDRIRAEASKDKNWPPAMKEFIVNMTSELFIPFPFSPAMTPGDFGPIYEMRSYTVGPGEIPAVVDRWAPSIEARMERSPLAVAMYTDLGPLNKFVHIWPYKSFEHRAETRAKAVADGIWPPKSDSPAGAALTQENLIMLPTPFSPMQ
jgi:hypothetical protein